MFVKEGLTEPRPIASMPGVVQHTRDSLRKAAVEAVAGRRRRADALRRARRARTRSAPAPTDPDGILNVAIARRRSPRSATHWWCMSRPVPRRVHRPRPLRRARRRRQRRQRRDPGALRRDGGRAGGGRRARARPVRHDGRPGRRRPRRARRRRLRSTRDPRLRREVRLRVLRPVPRGRRVARCRATAARYQQDPANRREALREVALDLAEGADIVMVKPALPYLDVLRRRRRRASVTASRWRPTRCRGEYAMVEAAAANGWIDRDADHPRDAHLDPPRRRRHRPHLLGRRGRPLSLRDRTR